MLAGNHRGDVAEVALGGDGTMQGVCVMRGGHYRDVRCAAWFVPDGASAPGIAGASADGGGVLVTGGEDGRLCQWMRRAGSVGGGSRGKLKASGKGRPRLGVSKHGSRAKKHHAKPY